MSDQEKNEFMLEFTRSACINNHEEQYGLDVQSLSQQIVDDEEFENFSPDEKNEIISSAERLVNDYRQFINAFVKSVEKSPELLKAADKFARKVYSISLSEEDKKEIIKKATFYLSLSGDYSKHNGANPPAQAASADPNHTVKIDPVSEGVWDDGSSQAFITTSKPGNGATADGDASVNELGKKNSSSAWIEVGSSGVFSRDELRGLYGVQQILEHDQERFSASDTDFIINGSAAVKSFSSNQSSLGSESGNASSGIVPHHYLENDRLVIVHPTADIIARGLKDKKQDAGALRGVVGEIIARRKLLSDELKIPFVGLQSKNVKEIHIIPEVSSGRLRNLGIGSESAQKASRHIRLRIIEKEPGAKNSTTKVFDPRDFGLGAQSTLDDTNCGRYVAAMAIQAAGLAKEGIEITKENLKASPAVQRALHFNTREDAQKGMENAYVKPLSKNPSPEEVIEHNVAKIKCLQSEYESRKGNANREFHGHAVGGGYKTASLLTSKAASFFKQAFSASDKSAAIETIKTNNAVDITNTDALKNFVNAGKAIDLSKLPPAARQGELGKCLSAIADAQKQLIAQMTQAPKMGR